MGLNTRTRKAYANEHREEINSFTKVSTVEIVKHDEDEWGYATFEYKTTPPYDAEEIYNKILDWFGEEAHPGSHDGLDGKNSAEFDGRHGKFTVHYPRR